MANAKHEQDLDVPLDSFLKTILDFPSYPSFVNGVKATSVVSQTAESMIVKMDLEMIKRIEYDIEVKHSRPDSNSCRVWWHLKSGDLFKKNDGEWLIKGLGDSKIHVTYSLDVEFNFSIPGFILKNLIKNSLPSAVDNFYSETKRRIS